MDKIELKPGETKEAFLLRLKNSPDGSYAKHVIANHLEPGLVFYENIQNPLTGKTGVMLKLTKDAMDRMRNSFEGKPVINKGHRPVAPTDFKNGLADGMVVKSTWNASTGKEDVEYFVWDEATKVAAQNHTGVSCAYIPTEIQWVSGTLHSVPYDGVISNGEYEHLAIVENPRYEDSKSLILNSKTEGGKTKMKLRFFEKDVQNAADLDDKTTIELENGKKVSILEMVTNFLKGQKTPEPSKMTNQSTVILEDGKIVPVADLVKGYLANMSKEEEEEKKKAEAKNSMCEKHEVKDCKDCMKAKNDKEEEEEKKKKEKAENEAAEKAKAAAAKGAGPGFKILDNAAQKRSVGIGGDVKIWDPREGERLGKELFGSDKKS